MIDYGSLWFVGTVSYLVLSVYGFVEMRSYVQACSQMDTIPFNNSVTKIALASIVCGLFTTLFFGWAVILHVFEFLKNLCRKRKK